MSKTVIREAVRGLAAKGWVEARPRLGTPRARPLGLAYVLDPDVLAWELRTVAPALLLRDFDEFRSAIEPEGARLAALRAEAEQLQRIRDAFAAMEASVDDSDAYLAADVEFHACLLDATNNRILRV